MTNPDNTKKAQNFGLYKEKLSFHNTWTPVKIVLSCCAVLIILAVIYTGIVYSNKKYTEEPEENLIVSESLKREEIRQLAPRPFGTNFKGPVPQQFATTTEKMTTVNYPQLTNYRHKYYPKNIQDIIGYVTKSRMSKPPREKQLGASNSPESFKENPSTSSGTAFVPHDPFHPYKPQDPGDINLLATASFRFAPPLWSNIRNKLSKNSQAQHLQQQQVDNTNVRETFNKLGRPIVLTLNIYPMDDPPIQQHRYGQRTSFPYRFYNDGRSKVIATGTSKGNRMTINLKLYPDMLNNIEVENETKVDKKVVKPTA